eukprot:scaffold52032_cov73-Phaeocystis_antarctica.AAC.1
MTPAHPASVRRRAAAAALQTTRACPCEHARRAAASARTARVARAARAARAAWSVCLLAGMRPRRHVVYHAPREYEVAPHCELRLELRPMPLRHAAERACVGCCRWVR